MNDSVASDNETLPEVVISCQASSVPHSFDTGYAIAYGVNEAIMIRTLQYFITANANRNHNFHNGKFWTYDTLQSFTNHFPYWSVQTCRTTLNSLVKQGIIIKGDFNKSWSNRTLWYAFKNQDHFIKNIRPPKKPAPILNLDDLPKEEKLKENSDDMLKSTNDICGNQHLSFVEINKCTYNTTAIAPSIPSSYPPSSDVADAPKKRVSPSNKISLEEQFSSEVLEVAEKMLGIIAKHNPVYRPPKDLTKFLQSIHEMLEIDGQKCGVLLKSFEWGVADTEQRDKFPGWQGIICSNRKGKLPSNPAEIFRDHFPRIYAQMNSHPKSKFGASSDHNEALQCMEEMNKRAIR